LTKVIAAQRLAEIEAVASKVQGWLANQAGRTLYQMIIQYSPNNTIVELGAWKGRSTVWMANGVKDRGDNGLLYSVDTWQGTQNEAVHKEMLKNYSDDQLFEEFLANINNAGISEYVKPIRSTTIEAAKNWSLDKPIGLLLIDADHEYKAARKDFEYWSPMVADEGFIVFDDVPAWPGPTKLITQLPHWYEQVAVSQGQWIVQKRAF